MESKKVSIITPAFNSADYIEATYRSILNQTFSNWEWLIVDDGSTDQTSALAQLYQQQDGRISYAARRGSPKGATTCRNEAIMAATGDYLIFLDTDDLLAPFALDQRVQAMLEAPECDFVVFQMLLFQSKTADLRLLWNVPDDRSDLDRAIRMNPVMAGSSTLWKTSSFKAIGMWDKNILINQDIELHIRAITSGLQYQLRLDLPPDLYVRNNPLSISRAKKKSIEKQRSRVYYFGTVVKHLQQHQLLNNHISAVRWLYGKLFFDLLYDQEPLVAKELFQLAVLQPGLLTPTYKRLSSFLLLWKKWAKYAVSMARFANRNLLHSATNKTHGKLYYDGPITVEA